MPMKPSYRFFFWSSVGIFIKSSSHFIRKPNLGSRSDGVKQDEGKVVTIIHLVSDTAESKAPGQAPLSTATIEI